MIFRQIRYVAGALYTVFADSGFSMAGAVAFSFMLSLFPFCIFLGALAGLLRRRGAGEARHRAAVRDRARAGRRGAGARGHGGHGPEPVRPADLWRAHCAVLRHQRHRKPACGAQRRLSRQRKRAPISVCLGQSALFVFAERRRHAGAVVGRRRRAGARGTHQAAVAAVAG